jgi:hypothetical protein
MFLPFLVSIPLTFISHASAECWRDTTCVPRKAYFCGPWDSYNLTPSSRVVSPVRILNSDRIFHSSHPSTGSTNLKANGSLVTFDFGKEVGGIVSLTDGAWNSSSGLVTLGNQRGGSHRLLVTTSSSTGIAIANEITNSKKSGAWSLGNRVPRL